MRRARFALWIALLLILTPALRADLYSYVASDDGAYKWEMEGERDLGDGFKLYELKLTSQVWQGITWLHSLRVIVPPNLKSPTLALLFITGSGKGEEELVYGKEICRSIRAPMAILHDVPYQPLFGGLREDKLIAYTFSKFIETEDETWPLLLPMVKSAVKAMDAVQEFSEEKLGVEVNGFVVTGASKRGWTTWLTAAVDERVKAIAPMVYDNLNLKEQMKHQLEAWGTFSEQINDYTERNLPQMVVRGENEQLFERLARLVDPYRHLERITVPKLIIIGTNDRYWPLDALNIYWDDLKGERFILYDPNSGHGLEDRDRVLADIIALFLKASGEIEFPKLSWEFEERDGKLVLRVRSEGVEPAKVQAWVAGSPTRDFREAFWESRPMREEDGSYVFELEKPSDGYSALFGEAIYEFGGKAKLFLSTQVRIVGGGG
ncbi:phenylacetic acid degradation protein [Candidatus Poribacteria bacterium]|nr:MAG: phenylacetic acid degradation protein [Candidatus Poribacteria bacterium]